MSLSRGDDNVGRTLQFISLVLVVAILTLALNGCGWRLRGSLNVDVNIPPIYVEFQNASPELRRELVQTLETSKVPVVKQPSEAELVLVIHAENRGRRVLSVNSAGKVSDYELQYELVFSVRDSAGAEVIAKDTITQQRDYSFDDTAVLAKGEEERKLFDFMRRMTIQSLMRRLHSLNKPKVAPAQSEATDPPNDAD